MSEGRGLKRQLTQEMVLNPLTRVRVLSDIGGSVQVDKAVPVKRYFRSGSEMERQVGGGCKPEGENVEWVGKQSMVKIGS